MKIRFKIALGIGILGIVVLLGFLGLSLFPAFIKSDWKDDLTVKEGAVSYEEMRSELFVELPIEPVEILRYSSEGGVAGGKFYLKMVFQNKLDATTLQGTFSTFSLGRNLNYKEAPYLPEEVPSSSEVWWWLPKSDPKMRYYQSEMGRNAPLFWVDQDGRTLFVFLGN